MGGEDKLNDEPDNSLDLDDPKLAREAKVSAGDVEDAAEFWARMAPEGFEGLVDAKAN